MAFGFTIALSIAFPLAWFMLRFKTTRSILQPLFVVIQCIPMFTLAPIMVIWFGWSFIAIVVPTALMIFFPLTLNIYQGLRSTPKPLLEFFTLNQATFWQTFCKLRLPAALPHIFAGFRISAAIAGVGAVAGEWAGAQSGLGILMLESRRNSDLEITFGALLCLTSLTLVLYGLILSLETLSLPSRRMQLRFSTAKLFAKKRRFALPFLCALLLPFLVGCQKKETSLLLDWLPNVNHVPLYVGIEKGYFEEEGIHLNIQKMFDNGGGISYLCSKKTDLLLAHLPGTFKAYSRGADIKLVATLIPSPLRGMIYLSDPHVTKPKDLSGKCLGYCIGGPDTTFLDFLLDQGEINPSQRKNVNADLISAMGTHAVDFIYGGFWNIEPYQLQSLGLETACFPIEELNVPPYYEMIILGNNKTRETSPEFVSAFQRALQKSIAYCEQQPEQAFQCYLLHNRDKSPHTIAWEKHAWEKTSTLFAKNQQIDRALIADFYQWQLQEHILSEPFDYQTLLSLYQ